MLWHVRHAREHAPLLLSRYTRTHMFWACIECVTVCFTCTPPLHPPPPPICVTGSASSGLRSCSRHSTADISGSRGVRLVIETACCRNEGSTPALFDRGRRFCAPSLLSFFSCGADAAAGDHSCALCRSPLDDCLSILSPPLLVSEGGVCFCSFGAGAAAWDHLCASWCGPAGDRRSILLSCVQTRQHTHICTWTYMHAQKYGTRKPLNV